MVGLELQVTAQATEVGTRGLPVAHAVQKCMYLLLTQSQWVLKRMAAECAGMTLVTMAVVELVSLVLWLMAAAIKVCMVEA